MTKHELLEALRGSGEVEFEHSHLKAAGGTANMLGQSLGRALRETEVIRYGVQMSQLHGKDESTWLFVLGSQLLEATVRADVTNPVTFVVTLKFCPVPCDTTISLAHGFTRQGDHYYLSKTGVEINLGDKNIDLGRDAERGRPEMFEAFAAAVLEAREARDAPVSQGSNIGSAKVHVVVPDYAKRSSS